MSKTYSVVCGLKCICSGRKWKHPHLANGIILFSHATSTVCNDLQPDCHPAWHRQSENLYTHSKQTSTKEPAIGAGGYMMCQCFPSICVISVGLISRENRDYTLSYLEIYYYCHYCYLYNFYKSPFKLNDWNPHHPIQRLQQATHKTRVKLVLGWIFGGYSLRSSRDFTDDRPVLAAGGRFAHLLEPHTESLETDLGTVNKYINTK